MNSDQHALLLNHVLFYEEVQGTSEEKDKLFNQLAKEYGQAGGIIIAAITKDDKVYYLATAFDVVLCWHEFNDPTEAENPLTYITVKNARKRLQQAKDDWPTAQVMLALWVHPDFQQANLKYVDVKNRFPGSPRQ